MIKFKINSEIIIESREEITPLWIYFYTDTPLTAVFFQTIPFGQRYIFIF